MGDDKMDKDNGKAKEEKNKPSPMIPGTKHEAEFFKEDFTADEQTIMPTMIDTSEEYVEKQRDLSSIIPSFEEMSDNENATELVSQDNVYKSDGAITLAYVNDNEEVTISQGAKLPEQIDMEKRKKEFAESKNVKKAKKKEKKDRLKARRSQKQQNHIAFGSLIVIIFLIGFGYWFFNHKTVLDFKANLVIVELGDALPAQKSSYITPGVGKDIEDIYYTLDLTKINLEVPGDYQYTVTYKDSAKTASKIGTVRIQDTKPPEINIRTVTITEGGEYDAASFVSTCRDPSGCNFSFQDSETRQKYSTVGSYVVYIVATDAFQNSITKKASLIIEAQGNVQTYSKYVNYNHNLGYELTEKYELHFREIDGILLPSKHEKIFQYQDQEKYEAARKEFQGELGYTCYDSEMKISYIEAVNIVGNNYSNTEDINSYLLHEGFTRES